MGKGENPTPRRPGSLRVQLTLWVVTITAVIQVTLAIVVFLYNRRWVTLSFERQLLETAMTVGRELSERDLVATELWGHLQPIAERESNRKWIAVLELSVFDEEGEFITSSNVEDHVRTPKRVAEALRRDEPAIARWRLDREHPVRGRAAIVPILIDGRRFALLASSPNAQVVSHVDALRKALLWSVPLGIVGAAVAGWYIAGIAIAPLHQIRRLARQIAPDSIGEPLEIEQSSSEIVALKGELDDALKRLERGYAAQERFLANVSHEIKTPISTLVTEAQSLRLERELAPPVERFVTSVEEEMRSLGRLVESFLLLTRVRDAGLPAMRRSCTINELIVDSVKTCAPFAADHDVRLRPHLLSSIDDIDLEVEGDPDLLRTMIDNLVRNAIRFSPKDRAVEVLVERTDAIVRVHVRDHGPGIPVDMLETIFDRFAQAPEERRRGRGSGLGLEIAEGIAELHGGEIHVENCDDGGCRFTVALPVARNGRSD